MLKNNTKRGVLLNVLVGTVMLWSIFLYFFLGGGGVLLMTKIEIK